MNNYCIMTSLWCMFAETAYREEMIKLKKDLEHDLHNACIFPSIPYNESIIVRAHYLRVLQLN